MSDDALAFAGQLTPRLSKYVPQKPTPKQSVFLLLNCPEAFFGGAAAGGKSSALLMAALQYVDIPGYNALLLRRTFADLIKPEALMDRAHEWLQGTDARWVEREKKWTFPTGHKRPATLSFGYMETEKDKYQYQGAAYHFVGYDELTQFKEPMYRYLFSRQRKTKEFMELAAETGIEIPLRMRSAANPGGIGHFWVKRRFIEEGREAGRVFIPAKMTDNPHVDHASYVSSLQELDPVELQQLLNGNWEIVEGGGQFERKWLDGRRLSFKAMPPMVKIIRAWDLAATKPNPANPDPDYTVGVLVGVDALHNYYILDVRRIRDNPGEVAEFIRQTCEEDEQSWGGDVVTWIEKEGGSSGKIVAQDWKRNVLAGYPVQFQGVTGKKIVRFRIVSVAARDGFVYIKQGMWVPALLDELETLGIKDAHDDQADALSLAFSKLRPHSNLSAATADKFAAAQERAHDRDIRERLTAVATQGPSQMDDEMAEAALRDSAAYKAAMERGRAFDFNL